jgi:hypothetical protein
MATEPINTSNSYSSTTTYVPPVGRLPILGKARAQIDQIRVSIAATLNEMKNRDASVANDTTRTTDSMNKTAAEIIALAAGTDNSTRKTTAEITALSAQSANDSTRTSNDTSKTTAEITALVARTGNETIKTTAEINAMASATLNSTNKAEAEVAALATQTINDTTKTTNDSTRTANDTAKSTAEITALASKTLAENNLLNQKAVTELAQTSDVLPLNFAQNTSTSVLGIIKNQKDLFAKQTAGFDRDAEQKLAKIMVDTWSVRMSAGETSATLTDTGLANADIKKVVDKARTNIGAI